VGYFSRTLQQRETSMASTALILTVLIASFLVGVKLTIDLIKERRRKVPLSHYFKQQSSRHR
jgi:hypothetical protein